jgi:excisionase family DNA binding protein
METETPILLDPQPQQQERIAYSVHEAAQMLGVHYFSVYWLVQRKKLHACRTLPGKLLIPRSELLRLLASS